MTKEFSKLSNDVRKLIQTGVYSLYRLETSIENKQFLLVTNNRDFFLLDTECGVAKKIPASQALSLKLGESVKFKSASSNNVASIIANSFSYNF